MNNNLVKDTANTGYYYRIAMDIFEKTGNDVTELDFKKHNNGSTYVFVDGHSSYMKYPPHKYFNQKTTGFQKIYVDKSGRHHDILNQEPKRRFEDIGV
jgi:prepilin-type processing-associated H-X9-DG protein